MGKIILLALLLIAALCGSCKPSLLVGERVKAPYINVGSKYEFYNSWGLELGIVHCDTIEVTAIEGYCVHFIKDGKEYIIDKKRFKYRMKPLNK